MPAKLLKPQPWHGDLLANPSLGAIVMLSEKGVPPYFPAISKDWGEGRRIIASAREGSGKRKAGKTKDKSEMEETSYYAARKMLGRCGGTASIPLNTGKGSTSWCYQPPETHPCFLVHTH